MRFIRTHTHAHTHVLAFVPALKDTFISAASPSLLNGIKVEEEEENKNTEHRLSCLRAALRRFFLPVALTAVGPDGHAAHQLATGPQDSRGGGEEPHGDC